MPTKKDIIEKINNSAVKYYTPEMVKDMITSLKSDVQGKPSRLKAGDVFVSTVNGYKARPCVIVSIQDSIVFAIALSTTNDHLNLTESVSRFWRDGYFSKCLVTVPYSYALENYRGVYDNEKLLRKARRELKNFICNIL